MNASYDLSKGHVSSLSNSGVLLCSGHQYGQLQQNGCRNSSPQKHLKNLIEHGENSNSLCFKTNFTKQKLS